LIEANMRLAVVSHKVCWLSDESSTGYATDGGFPMQIGAISELFDQTEIVVPVSPEGRTGGLLPLAGHNVSIKNLSVPQGEGLLRKLSMPFWLLGNCRSIWTAVKNADAVHAPIPGDVGTIGLLIALIQRKPLFVRHCGNWMVQRTAAERFWKWIMEASAGGRNVMFATGGSATAPSTKNPKVRWVFSTSLRQAELGRTVPRELPADGEIRMIIACRQENKKGTDVVVKSLPEISKSFPNVMLDVVGGGSQLNNLKMLAASLGVSDKVTFHGHIAQTKVIDLLNRAHLFCFPTTASEGFPKAVLEALASGLPVVTTRVSVLPVLIGNGCGQLLDDATPESLADAVKKICSDPEKYRTMSLKALETARGYSLENWRDLIGQTLRLEWNVASLSSTGPTRS
jgi:glycosyltransferase involved in cell wall biosynthesis